MENISAVGLKKPITVACGKPGDDGGGETFDLVCGQGRLEAFIALGQKEVPALVRDFSVASTSSWRSTGLGETGNRPRNHASSVSRPMLWG